MKFYHPSGKPRMTPENVTAEDIMTYGQGLPQDRRVLLLAAIDNNYQHLSAEFGIPVGTVKSRINRARVKVLKAKQTHAQNTIQVSNQNG